MFSFSDIHLYFYCVWAQQTEMKKILHQVIINQNYCNQYYCEAEPWLLATCKTLQWFKSLEEKKKLIYIKTAKRKKANQVVVNNQLSIIIVVNDQSVR